MFAAFFQFWKVPADALEALLGALLIVGGPKTDVCTSCSRWCAFTASIKSESSEINYCSLSLCLTLLRESTFEVVPGDAVWSCISYAFVL